MNDMNREIERAFGIKGDPMHRIEHAWMVVEKIAKDHGYYVEVLTWPDGKATCTVFESAEACIYHATEGGGTAPEAICLAALAAKEGK